MSYVKYYKGKYYQGSLSDNNANAVLNLLETTAVTDIKHEVLNLPYHIIEDLITKYTEKEKADGFVKQGTFKVKDEDLIVGTLRDEQTIGVAFMYLNGSCLLGDEVGLGKTVQIAGLYNIVRKQKAANGEHFSMLFLSEKTSVEQLRSKLIQFTGEYFGLLLDAQQGTINKFIKARDNGSDYSVVATHAAFGNNAFLESLARHRFDLLVMDESALVRNTSTGVYEDAKALVKLFKNVILLNATPVEMGALDIYNQLKLVDGYLLPSKAEFEDTYCVKEFKPPHRFDIVGYKNTDKFKEAISLRYLARTRKDLGGDYEDNVYTNYICPLSPIQRKLMKSTTLYRLCAEYPTGVKRQVDFNDETCGKLRVLYYLLNDIDLSEGKVLIYVFYKECQMELYQLLKDKGYRCAIINGDISGKERGSIIQDANAGLYDIIITNIYRAYDLPQFVHCIFYTIDYNPQKMVQFEGRITRDINVIGKRVYLLISEGKELKALEKIRERIAASEQFSTTGRSMVTAAIMSKDYIDMRGSKPERKSVQNIMGNKG